MPDWLEPYRDVLLWLATGSLISLAVSVVVIPILVVRIPGDYFTRPRHAWSLAGHTVPQIVLLLIKNILGLVFVLTGIALLVLPGQGILTILIGLMVMDFPGKFALERWIVARPAVLRSMNWIRRKARRQPLTLH